MIPAGLMVLALHVIHIGGIRHRTQLASILTDAGLTVLAERKVPRMAGNIPVLVIGPTGEVERAMGIEPT